VLREVEASGAASADAERVRQRWSAVALAVVPALTHLAHLLTTQAQARYGLYEDDAYYYLGVAREIAAGNGSTFTGLVETNGYHPLWMAVLVPLATVLRDPVAMLVGLAVVQGALWALAVREALRIGRTIGCWRCAAGAIAVYGVLAVLTGHLAFNGMESALVLPLFLMLVRMGLEAGDRPRDDLRLGVLLALICLARLDAALAAVPFGVVLLYRDAVTPPERVRRALRLGCPTAVALGAYVAVNHVMFGSATPVSGRAKSLGAPFFNSEPLTQLVKAGDLSGRSLWFGAVALVLVAVAWRSPWRGDSRRARLMAFILALVAGQALLTTYLVIGTSYRVWPWYHYLVALFASLATMLVIRAAADRFGETVTRVSLAAAAVFLVLQVAVVFRPEGPEFPQSATAARFVENNLADDAVLAMGDRAGIFGYLAHRPLLQLEGLVADKDYLDRLATGGAVDRMIDEGVDYYVWYGPDGQRITLDGRPCEEFVEPLQGGGPKQIIVVCDDDRVYAAGPDGDRLQIWRFDPSLNGG
jgi:hypothetical protein